MSSYGDAWADTYDRVHTITEDIPFWVEEALASGWPVLELACGTGRVAIPIAQAGVPVVGLDSSAAMLKLARAKARRLKLGSERVRFVHGDMRSFSLAQRFPLAIIPFRSFQLLLSVAEQHQALETIRAHIAPGGRLIVDLFVPDPELLTGDSSTPRFDHEVVDPTTGHQLIVWSQPQYDNFNQVINNRTIVEEMNEHGEVVHRSHVDSQMRYSYRFEVLHLLAASGYEVEEVYGSFDREPLSESSTEMIWVATPAD